MFFEKFIKCYLEFLAVILDVLQKSSKRELLSMA